MLEMLGVHKSFAGPRGPVKVLADFSLRLEKGEFVAVRGASGSGKTTLLLLAGGMLHPDAGTVRLAGQDVYGLGAEARAQLRAEHVGFVFQQFHLAPYLSVLDNVLAPELAQRTAGARERALELLNELGLAERVAHLPGQLSSGERQRTALARALLHRPGLILADEPTGNLDAQSGGIVLDHLARYAAGGAAVLLVTHDVRAAERSGRIVELDGKVS